jgi:hypothetical protein
MKVNVIFAKHQDSKKFYLFEVDSRQINPAYIKSGDTLFVNTCKGMAVVTAVTNVVSIYETDLENFCKMCGAYLPLKKCAEKVSREFMEYIQENIPDISAENNVNFIKEDDILPY